MTSVSMAKMPSIRMLFIVTTLCMLMRLVLGNRKSRGVSVKTIQERRKNNLHFLRKFVSLLSICVPSARSKETGYMVALTVLLLLRTGLSIIHVKLGAMTATNFVSRRWTGLNRSITQFALLSIPATFVNAALKYVQDMLSMTMRKNLSQYINKRYLNGTSFLRAAHNSTDRPDETITKGVEQYSEQVANIYCHLVKPFIDVVIYTLSLASIIGWQGPAIIWAYFGMRQQLSNLLVPKTETPQSAYEKRHRAAHRDVIKDSDEIAFNGGASRDRIMIQNLLDAATTDSTSVRARHALVTAYDTLLLKYGASVAGYAVLLSPYLLGLQRVKFKTSNVMMRDYIICLKSLTELNRGISEIRDGFSLMTGIEDVTINVAGLIDTVEECRIAYPPTLKDKPRDVHNAPEQADEWIASWRAKCREEDQEEGKRSYHGRRSPPSNRSSPNTSPTHAANNIQFRKVAVTTPEGLVLLKDLSFTVEEGENLLITGRKGSGKTAIFRMLGGLWKLHSGSITKPRPSDMQYLSEMTHLVDGTLRDQVIYPHTEEEAKALGVSDGNLAKLLCLIDHSQTILGTWSLKETKDWRECLSMQQRQCVGIARMFYHLPRYALFDECTSHLSAEVEAYVYKTCKALGITVITAARSLCLTEQHTNVLSITSAGYEYEPVENVL